MPLVQIPVGFAPCQIDDFPREVEEGKESRPFERSCKGAMFLRPASTKVMSSDEIDWLKAGKGKAKKYAKLAQRLTIVRVDVVPDKSDRPWAEPLKGKVSAASSPKPTPMAPPPPAPEPIDEGDSKGSDKKRKWDR